MCCRIAHGVEFLLSGNDNDRRRAWAVGLLLADLLDGFVIDLFAYAIMSNQVHLVLCPRLNLAARLRSEKSPSRIADGDLV